MTNITRTHIRRAASASVLATTVLGAGLAASASASAATLQSLPITAHVAAGNTAPAFANPTAQLRATGVKSKTVEKFGGDSTWTTITYTNGTYQKIVETKNAKTGERDVSNMIKSPSGSQLRYEMYDAPGTSKDSQALSVRYAATTKTDANVRKGQSTSTGVIKVLKAGTKVNFEQFVSIGAEYAGNTQNIPGWGNVSGGNSDVSGDAYMAESTLNLVPVS